MILQRIESAVIASLLIIAFQPFGLHSFGHEKWLFMIGITIINLIACLTSELIVCQLFRMPHDETQGTKYIIRRNYVFQVVNIILSTSAIALFLDAFANNDKVDNHLCWSNVGVVFAVVLVTTLLIGLYKRSQYWKKHYAHQLEEAQRLNGILQERERLANKQGESSIQTSNEPIQQQQILLEGTTKESIQLSLSDFIFAESSGNYVTIYHLNNDIVQKTVLRTSIKNVVAMICITPNIIQCHRAFIVNLQHINRVQGRSSGIGLSLNGVDDIIPVSRQYVQEVKAMIQNPE